MRIRLALDDSVSGRVFRADLFRVSNADGAPSCRHSDPAGPPLIAAVPAHAAGPPSGLAATR